MADDWDWAGTNAADQWFGRQPNQFMQAGGPQVFQALANVFGGSPRQPNYSMQPGGQQMLQAMRGGNAPSWNPEVPYMPATPNTGSLKWSSQNMTPQASFQDWMQQMAQQVEMPQMESYGPMSPLGIGQNFTGEPTEPTPAPFRPSPVYSPLDTLPDVSEVNDLDWRAGLADAQQAMKQWQDQANQYYRNRADRRNRYDYSSAF